MCSAKCCPKCSAFEALLNKKTLDANATKVAWNRAKAANAKTPSADKQLLVREAKAGHDEAVQKLRSIENLIEDHLKRDRHIRQEINRFMDAGIEVEQLYDLLKQERLQKGQGLQCPEAKSRDSILLIHADAKSGTDVPWVYRQVGLDGLIKYTLLFNGTYDMIHSW